MKNILVTPCFARAELFELSARTLMDKLTPGVVDEKWVLDNHYPCGEDNSVKIKAAAAKYGYSYFDSGADLGLQGSLNNFYKHNPQPAGTIHIGVDPDSTSAVGFDKAIVDVMRADSNLVMCATMNTGIDDAIAKGRCIVLESVIGGHSVFVHPNIEMVNVCGYNLDWINSVGGFDQPNKYYGGLEIALYRKFKRERLVFLLDVPNVELVDSHLVTDPKYRQWKTEHLKGYKGSFKEWLSK